MEKPLNDGENRRQARDAHALEIENLKELLYYKRRYGLGFEEGMMEDAAQALEGILEKLSEGSLDGAEGKPADPNLGDASKISLGLVRGFEKGDSAIAKNNVKVATRRKPQRLIAMDLFGDGIDNEEGAKKDSKGTKDIVVGDPLGEIVVSDDPVVKDGRLVIEGYDVPVTVVNNGDVFAFDRMLSEEDSIAFILNEIAPRNDDTTLPEDIRDNDDATIKRVVENIPKDFCSIEQRRAVCLALMKKLVLVTGGPGTGKTSSVVGILASLCKLSKRMPEIALLAPTGKAASNLSNSLRRALDRWTDLDPEIKNHLRAIEGSTLHRHLGIYPPEYLPVRNPNNPIREDIIVVDEASMMDVAVFKFLLFAMRTDQRLILLGDINQLPAVGLGEILDIFGKTSAPSDAAMKKIEEWTSSFASTEASDSVEDMSIGAPKEAPGVMGHVMSILTVSRRFDSKSGIGNLAKHTLEKKDLREDFKIFANDLFHREMPLDEKLFNDVFEKQRAYWDAARAGNIEAMFKEFYNVMVLTVLRRNSEAFNMEYLRFLNAKRVIGEDMVGIPYLVSSNDAALGVSNGDICFMVKNPLNSEVEMCFNFGSASGEGGNPYSDAGDDGRPGEFGTNERGIFYPRSRLPNHNVAFAITTHKSQGSEYEHIHFLSPFERKGGEFRYVESEVFNNALFYTAITRAKQTFTFHGDFDILSKAVNNTDKRLSLLKPLIKAYQNGGDFEFKDLML